MVQHELWCRSIGGKRARKELDTLTALNGGDCIPFHSYTFHGALGGPVRTCGIYAELASVEF
jgi:hypothetical protein